MLVITTSCPNLRRGTRFLLSTIVSLRVHSSSQILTRFYSSRRSPQSLDIPYPTHGHMSAKQYALRNAVGAAKRGEMPKTIKNLVLTKEDRAQWNYELTQGDSENDSPLKHIYKDYVSPLRDARRFSSKSWRSLLNKGAPTAEQLENILNYFKASPKLRPFSIELEQRLKYYYNALTYTDEVMDGAVWEQDTAQNKLKLSLFSSIVLNNMTNTSRTIVNRERLLGDKVSNEVRHSLTPESLVEVFSVTDTAPSIKSLDADSLENVLSEVSSLELTPELSVSLNNLYQAMVDQKIPLSSVDTYNWISITQPENRYVQLIHLIEKSLDVESQHLNLVLRSSLHILNEYDILSFIDACKIEPDRSTFMIMLQYAVGLENSDLFVNLVEMMIKDYGLAVDAHSGRLLVRHFKTLGYPHISAYIAKNIINAKLTDSDENLIDGFELCIYDFLTKQDKKPTPLQFKMPLTQEELQFFQQHNKSSKI